MKERDVINVIIGLVIGRLLGELFIHNSLLLSLAIIGVSLFGILTFLIINKDLQKEKTKCLN